MYGSIFIIVDISKYCNITHALKVFLRFLEPILVFLIKNNNEQIYLFMTAWILVCIKDLYPILIFIFYLENQATKLKFRIKQRWKWLKFMKTYIPSIVFGSTMFLNIEVEFYYICHSRFILFISENYITFSYKTFLRLE